MIVPIKDYIRLPLDQRQAHLNLNEECLERGGFSTKFCGVLAEGLDTTIPERKKDGVLVHLCHACHNNKCSNIRHLYWGTPQENFLDAVRSGRSKMVWDSTVSKYGFEKAKILREENRQKAICASTSSAGRSYKPVSSRLELSDRGSTDCAYQKFK